VLAALSFFRFISAASRGRSTSGVGHLLTLFFQSRLVEVRRGGFLPRPGLAVARRQERQVFLLFFL